MRKAVIARSRHCEERSDEANRRSIPRHCEARRAEAISAKRKAKGLKLGRPAGPVRTLRLDTHADKIDEYLAVGIDKRSVAKLLDVAPNVLYLWVKLRRFSFKQQLIK